MINLIKKFLEESKPTHTFHPGYDDEFYINEIIGIDEITYDDWIGE
jgi:hypothetical protein|tara:strand:- start:5 stop:142 length:138 start_codon:yes stop_codon:yes gene_type:complete